MVRVLEIHGIQTNVLESDRPAQVECFQTESVTRRTRPFQGHRLKTFEPASGSERRSSEPPEGRPLRTAPRSRWPGSLLCCSSPNQTTAWVPGA